MAEIVDPEDDPWRREARQRAYAIERVRQERERYPWREDKAIMDVATEIGKDQSTIARWLREERDGQRQAKPPGRASRSDGDIVAAVEAWRNLYGSLPSGNDWAATRLRYKASQGGRRARARLARLEAGWTDAQGRHQEFPRWEKQQLEGTIERLQRAGKLF